MAKKQLSSLTCKECQRAFTSVLGLTRHLTQTHSLKTQAYWDKHEGKAVCEICSKPTAFESLASGYARTCGHSCGCKLFRAELRLDPKRQQQFITRISDAQVTVWSHRSDKECKLIRSKDKSFLSQEEIKTTMEAISIRDAHHMGIALTSNESAFDQTQRVVSKALCDLLGVQHG